MTDANGFARNNSLTAVLMVELHFHLLPRLVSSVGKAVDPIYRSRFISPLDSRVAFLHVEQPTRGCWYRGLWPPCADRRSASGGPGKPALRLACHLRGSGCKREFQEVAMPQNTSYRADQLMKIGPLLLLS